MTFYKSSTTFVIVNPEGLIAPPVKDLQLTTELVCRIISGGGACRRATDTEERV